MASVFWQWKGESWVAVAALPLAAQIVFIARLSEIGKLEPWNSVRVTLSIPREAALRLRQLANDGSQLLHSLGILSVQVDGDQVICLRLLASTPGSEPHQLLLRTNTHDGNDRTTAVVSSSRPSGMGEMLSGLLSGASPQPSTSGICKPAPPPPEKVQFKSPNVVCPGDSVVPRPLITKPHQASPFPFTSMNQAMHSSAFVAPKPPPKLQMPPPPPPYPTTMSSPLLVNLLQNDSSSTPVTAPPVARQPQRTVPVPLRLNSVLVNTPASPSALTRPPPSASAPPPPGHFPKAAFMPPPPPPPKPAVPISAASATADLLPPPPPPPHQINSNNPGVLDPFSRLDTQLDSLKMDPHPLDTHRIDPQVIDAHAQRIDSNILDSHRIDQHLLDLQALDLHALDTHAIDPQVLDRHLDMRNLRPPPPYSEAVARSSWQSFIDMTPALPDLKADDLDEILPSLEDLEDTPILPEDLLSTSPINLPPVHDNNNSSRRNFLINPLTGELEPQSGGESEVEDIKDVFKGLESPHRLSDEDSGSTIRQESTIDLNDSDSRSQGLLDSNKASRVKNKIKEKGRDSPTMKPTEKIKLRLKLEKSEPVNPAYKVDVSFINTQPKKAASSVISGSPTSNTPDSELRVPPLHISLKGRNHVVINNKKKTKLPGERGKVRRVQDHPNKLKRDGEDDTSVIPNNVNPLMLETNMMFSEEIKNKTAFLEMKKAKKIKLTPEFNKDVNNIMMNSNSHLLLNDALMKGRIPIPDPPPYKERREDPPPYKERTDDPPPYKERRGSDSELIRCIGKYSEANGLLTEEKRRRLSQTDVLDPGEPPTVPGSTNIGTVGTLPLKIRKGKDGFKSVKDVTRNKNHPLKLSKQVGLPIGDVDMEAKFKQRLLEGSGPPHRTEAVHQVTQVVVEKTPPPVDNNISNTNVSTEEKCNTPEHSESVVKTNNNNLSSNGAVNCNSASVNTNANNGSGSGGGSNASTNTGSGGTREGEDSGIESMDALSEKSPNQIGQSPPTEIVSKTQVPDMLDIEAQLAKMEGQCCESSEMSKEELEPLPVRVTPPLYTYSNQEKGRNESPSLSDEDSNSCSGSGMSKKSLLEQLLIEIPEQHIASSISPNTRSVRTRAASKLESPELNSPVGVKPSARLPSKRKRQESESSTASLEDANKGKKIARKSIDISTDLVKPCLSVDVTKVSSQGKRPHVAVTGTNQVQLKAQDESSDSDEPLMEKVRKNNNMNSGTLIPSKGKIKPTVSTVNNKNNINTRRSARSTMPAQNTRSKGDKPITTTTATTTLTTIIEPDVARRKTRSAASEVDKRKKEVK